MANPFDDPRRYHRGVRHALIAATLALAGCAVGPDFQRPKGPDVERYTAADVADVPTPVGRAVEQQVTSGAAVPAQWWAVFHSSALDDVVQRAIAGNQTLIAARATLAAAHEAIVQARAAFYPQLDLAGSYSYEKAGGRGGQASSSVNAASSGSAASQTFNLYSVGPTASYVPDVFGGTRRHVEQETALAEKQRYELAAAYLSLSGNAVTQAMNIASARLQLAAAEDIIADDEQIESLVRQKFDAGKAADVDVLTAESQLANDRAQLPPLRQQLSAARHALAILLGRFPGEWSAPDFDLGEFELPRELPLTLPSELVHQRPDILAAETQLHADSAAVGVATAQLYPSFTLSAAVSVEGVSSSAVFPASSTVWNLVAGATAPLFHGGALVAQRRAAIETFDASLGTYRQTVLTAFGQVADTLRALEHDGELVDAERRALETSDRARALQRISYEAGKSDLLQLLDAERSYQQARLGYTRAQAQRLQDTTQLFVALGGDWWDTAAPV